MAISLAALIVSAATLVKQAIDARQERNLVILTDVLEEFRSAEFQAHRVALKNFSAEDLRLDKEGHVQPEIWKHLQPVLHFYDNVGLLIAMEIVNEDPLLIFFGQPIIDTWAQTKGFVHRRRFIQQDYLKFFEHASVRAKERRPKAVAELKLLSDDDS